MIGKEKQEKRKYIPDCIDNICFFRWSVDVGPVFATSKLGNIPKNSIMRYERGEINLRQLISIWIKKDKHIYTYIHLYISNKY